MENITNLKQYYQTSELFLPYKSEWRYFLFLLPSGKMKRFYIKNEKQLRKLLIKFVPNKVYFSSGAWLNVRNVRGKKNKEFAIKVFEDVIFDIDSENINNANKSALEIVNKIGKPDKIVKTNRGFHLWYTQRRDRKELIRKLKGIKDLDIHCTENEFNVYALPLTIKNGEICKFVELEELIPYNDKGELERPKANDPSLRKENLRSDVSVKTQSNINKPGTLTSSQDRALLSISNQVKRGLFIPILIYEKSFRGLKKEVDTLNNLYNLGDLYCFESERYYVFISLRCFEERQLQKVLNQSSSITKIQQKKFHKIWVDISEYQLMGVVRYKTNKYFRASRKHYNFIKDCGIKIGIIDELVGHSKLQIIEVHKK